MRTIETEARGPENHGINFKWPYVLFINALLYIMCCSPLGQSCDTICYFVTPMVKVLPKNLARTLVILFVLPKLMRQAFYFILL